MHTVTRHRSTRTGRPRDIRLRKFVFNEPERLLFTNRAVDTNGQGLGMTADTSMAVARARYSI